MQRQIHSPHYYSKHHDAEYLDETALDYLSKQSERLVNYLSQVAAVMKDNRILSLLDESNNKGGRLFSNITDVDLEGRPLVQDIFIHQFSLFYMVISPLQVKRELEHLLGEAKAAYIITPQSFFFISRDEDHLFTVEELLVNPPYSFNKLKNILLGDTEPSFISLKTNYVCVQPVIDTMILSYITEMTGHHPPFLTEIMPSFEMKFIKCRATPDDKTVLEVQHLINYFFERIEKSKAWQTYLETSRDDPQKLREFVACSLFYKIQSVWFQYYSNQLSILKKDNPYVHKIRVFTKIIFFIPYGQEKLKCELDILHNEFIMLFMTQISKLTELENDILTKKIDAKKISASLEQFINHLRQQPGFMIDHDHHEKYLQTKLITLVKHVDIDDYPRKKLAEAVIINIADLFNKKQIAANSADAISFIHLFKNTIDELHIYLGKKAKRACDDLLQWYNKRKWTIRDSEETSSRDSQSESLTTSTSSATCFSTSSCTSSSTSFSTSPRGDDIISFKTKTTSSSESTSSSHGSVVNFPSLTNEHEEHLKPSKILENRKKTPIRDFFFGRGGPSQTKNPLSSTQTQPHLDKRCGK